MLSAVAIVLLVPPVNLVLVALAGMALARRRPRAGRRVTLGALLLMLVLALPVTATLLLASLEHGLGGGPAGAVPQAIVILGGDAAPDGPAPQRSAPGGLTLERLRGGAALARATHLPVLVTGGVVGADGPPVALLMAQSLAADFGVPAHWVEARARDTWQNAAFSAAILRRDGIGTVYVVTHAWHMRRALIAFRAAGLAAVPVPLLAEHELRLGAGSFAPRMTAWLRSYFALHEWIGCAWYALRAAW